MSNLRLPFGPDPDSFESRIDARDRAGRARAVDPRYNVALEASAGTGKTRVLVDRYINLLRAGVDPSNILAITFTRKAAAEMRERILAALRTAGARGEIPAARWRELRDRTGDIDISTIDAFCLSLLREFPLEADLDPGFTMADDTEVPRLIDESLDRALRICRSLAREDEHVALVFAQLGDRRARAGLAALLTRRIVAPGVLARYLERNRRDLTVSLVSSRAAKALMDVFSSMDAAIRMPSADEAGGGRPDPDLTDSGAGSECRTDGFRRFVASGPADPGFMLLVRQIETLDGSLAGGADPDPARVQAAYSRARDYFLTRDGQPRSRLPHKKALFTSPAQWAIHKELVGTHAPRVAAALARYRRDLNVLVSRGVWRMFRIADAEYRRTLDAHAVLDFSELLLRTLDLLRQMEEFARSRYRLESRYHHVLVDEFQDTSRAQWELISLLVRAWGEGVGLADAAPLTPSIFIVGDRKQSIYRFRDADVSVLQDAARHLEGLRPDRDVRRSISRSFRSVPPLLAFVNDVCRDIDKAAARRDAFEYGEEDWFPLDVAAPDRGDALGLVVAERPEACAEVTAREIARLLSSGTTVRDIATGVARPVRASDVAILFRTRESHREFEASLERQGIAAYVYKGLGFFDADEVKDVLALLWHLADPASNLRAAAWMRSGFVRLSDEALRSLAPHLAGALTGVTPGSGVASLAPLDSEALMHARRGSARWRRLVDRVPAAELLDAVLSESAYALEMRGPRLRQARENLKKVRGLVRRVQNKGYATLGRIVAHLDRLAVGDESNAVIDAGDAVHLMTIHAAKGLEFPVVFLVNLARGTGNRRYPIRVAAADADDDVSVSVGDFESQSDADQAAMEREETKRLLYVALTRARDRLYLGTTTKDGLVQAGRGSLAEVLPLSLAGLLAGAVAGGSVNWQAASGAVHTFTVCAPAAEDSARSDMSAALQSEGDGRMEHDFPPVLVRSERSDRGDDVGTARSRREDDAPSERSHSNGSGRLRGALVHRLLHRIGLPRGGPGPESDSGLLADQIEQLIRPDERDGLEDAVDLVPQVIHAYRGLAMRPEVVEVYGRGEAFHEVPFTTVNGDTVVRGTIDCLIRSTSASRGDTGSSNEEVTILEFKTGRPRPDHHAQALAYRHAVEEMFPGARVGAQLVYLDGIEPV